MTEAVLDLGLSPAGDAAVQIGAASPVVLHPLQVLACAECGLVQLGEHDGASAGTCEMRSRPACGGRQLAARLVERLGLGAETEAIVHGADEEALAAGLAASGAAVLALAGDAQARGRGGAVFGSGLARRLRGVGHAPALICARRALAEAPDPHDLAAGWRILLAPGGTLVAEVPNLLRLVDECRLDAISLERRSYFSLATLEMLLAEHRLAVFDLEDAVGEEPALRVFVRHLEDHARPVTAAVADWREAELRAGLHRAARRQRFAAEVADAKCALLDFLIGLRAAGRRVLGFGAPPGADRLLSYCGIGPDLLPCVVDPLPGRHGLLLPASRIPVLPPSALREARPDVLLLLGWSGPRPRPEDTEAEADRDVRLALPLPRIALL